jgi:alkanesulfonate monooxygenase SsuD/methylene tetrahydromethanopterin reductase-like flavin-dependent oxidoreductase (luciferase family)
MKIGIGLPNPVPGTSGVRLLEWARRAEERGFSALATIDRVAYPSYDSLTCLAAAAGATTRIGLMTNILLAPAYPAVLLAKSTSSLDQISAGRLTLGLAPGGRADDFVAAGRDFHTRGRAFDAALETLHKAWRGEPVGEADKPVCPTPINDDRVPNLIGGTSANTMRRVAAWGAGWTMGGGTADMAAPVLEQVRAAWREAGRDGEPRVAALAYFSLGDDADSDSRAYLHDYYGFLGDYADRVADGALRSQTAVTDAVRAFEEIGISELFFDPTTADLHQVDRLADIVL